MWFCGIVNYLRLAFLHTAFVSVTAQCGVYKLNLVASSWLRATALKVAADGSQ